MGDSLEDCGATSAMSAVLGAGGADAACGPVVRKGFVVYDDWREEAGVDGIQEIEEIAVIVARSVGGDDFRRIGDSPCGEFAEGDVWFPEVRVFRADPCGADDVFKGVVAAEMLLAEHEGEIELLCGGGLPGSVMAMDVVVERLEGAFADATAVELDADAFAVLRGPFGGLPYVFQIAVVFAREIEFVENVRHGFKSNRAMGTQIDGGADPDGREIPSDDGRYEWRSRGDDIRKEAVTVHFTEDVLHLVRQLLADGVFSIAVAVEKRVEQDVVCTAPFEICDEPFAEFRREIRGGAAGEHARPSEKDFTDAWSPGGARMDEVFIEKMPDGEIPARRALVGVLVMHEFCQRQPFLGGVSVVFLFFNERLDFLEGDIADAGDEVASRPQRGETGLQFGELLAEDVGGIGFDFADDGADALVWGDLDAEVDMVAHDFRGVELVAEFLLLFMKELEQAFVHAVGKDFPPIFRAENNMVLAAVTDVVDVLVLFWQVDDVHFTLFCFFSTYLKVKK